MAPLFRRRRSGAGNAFAPTLRKWEPDVALERAPPPEEQEQERETATKQRSGQEQARKKKGRNGHADSHRKAQPTD